MPKTGRPPTLNFEVGQRIGRGVVLDPQIRVTGGKRGALLRCDCGSNYEAALLSLVERRGRINTTSCGCARREQSARIGRETIKVAKAAWVAKQPGYGLSGHPLYAVWHNMLSRCENPDNVRWEHYGGRGIEVCDRWHDLRQFIEDVETEIGPHPGRGWSLDRRDGNGNYEPGKVRWATYSQQNRNKDRRDGRSKGVSKIKDLRYGEGRTGWVARIHLGTFLTEDEAAGVYQRAVAVLEREGILT